MSLRTTAGSVAISNGIVPPDGSSKIVLLSEKTVINKASFALKSDLKTGEKVAVFGTENTDGSTLAQNIQLKP